MGKLVTTYSVSFRGIFGRNRSVKFTSSNAAEVEATVPCDDAEGDAFKAVDVKKLADDFASKIGAKRGDLRVTRYDNTEDMGDGLYVVPITQGVIVLMAKVGE
jgi:hypothetical protein